MTSGSVNTETIFISDPHAGPNRGARPPRAVRAPSAVVDEVLSWIGDRGGEGVDEFKRIEELLQETGARIGWGAHAQASAFRLFDDIYGERPAGQVAGEAFGALDLLVDSSANPGLAWHAGGMTPLRTCAHERSHRARRR